MEVLNLQLTVLNGELAEINKKIEVLEKEEDDPKTDAKRLEVVQGRLHELKAEKEARNKQREELPDKLQPGGNLATEEPNFKRQKVNHSAEYVGLLLPAQPMLLPKTKGELSATLFPEPESQLLPVTAEFYGQRLSENRQQATDYLQQTDGSEISSLMSGLLKKRVVDGATEMQTSFHIVYQMTSVFEVLQQYKKGSFPFDVLLNSTEGFRSSQRTVKQRVRPDTMVVVSNCTLLIGEDKWQSLGGAVGDLRAKRKGQHLLRMHYGEVLFLLGYAAAGSRFQWFWLSADGSQVEEVGPELDLKMSVHRYQFLLSLVNAYCILGVMAQNLPRLSGRLALYTEIRRPCGRYVVMLADGAKKVIPSFSKFCRDNFTSLALIHKAYEAAAAAAAASNPPFLVSAAASPTDASNCFEVSTRPGGYAAVCTSEKDVQSLALACCKAACVLHEAGMVHRDFRFDNIVQLSPDSYMIIDLESVGDASAGRLPKGFALYGWDAGTLDDGWNDGCYTKLSDMYQIGKLVGSQISTLTGGVSSNASSFVEQLRSKKLNADESVRHPWFQIMF